MAVIGAAGSAGADDRSSAASQPDDHHDAKVEWQSEKEGEAHDLALVAEGKGWSIAEAEADRRAADVVGDIAERVAAKHPDVFVGSVLSEDPRGAPALYVKGPANTWIKSLVADAPIDVRLVDQQPFSFEELEARNLAVHMALVDYGFDTVGTGFRIDEGGVIRAGVTRVAERSDSSAVVLSEIELPDDLRGDVVLSISDEPNVVDEHAYGGMQVRDDGVDECTSGWAVKNGAGTTGFTTAGHCEGINQIVEPGVGVYTTVHQGEHRGQWGDVEWKTTTQIEDAHFYATATSIRNVDQLEARANISQGESICGYGRATDDRDCDLDVEQVSRACTNGGVFNNRLVLMDGDTLGPGDSGGGWSWVRRAYGSHKGNCADLLPSIQDTFSVADLYDEALGVTVRIHP